MRQSLRVTGIAGMHAYNAAGMVAEGRSVVRRDRVVAGAILGLSSLFTLVMRAALPINPISLDHAGFDGGLFENLAVSLAHHDWLGPLNTLNHATGFTEPLALAKGPMYSIFIVFAYRLHLPLQVAEQIVYLIGCATIAAAVFVTTRRPVASAAVYAVLAFEPANFSAISTQITRENLYSGVALGFVGGFFLAVWFAVHARRTRLASVIAVVTGLWGGVFWLTREEGVWVLSALVLIVVGLLAARAHELHADRQIFLRLAARLSLVLAIVAVAMAVPVFAVRMKNDSVYGVSLTNDFSAGTFPRAYAEWSRVRGVPLRAFVPIDRQQRLAVYQVSAAARDLSPRLEDPTNGWLMWGCQSNNVCDDYAGGAEPWAFREAAYMAGRYTTGKTAQDFFGRIARDIDHACADHRLKCARRLPVSLQLVQRASATAVLSSAGHWLARLPDDAMVFYPYGPPAVNEATKADLATVSQAVRGTPRTPARQVAAAKNFTKHNLPYRFNNRLYKILFPALLVLAVVGLVMSALPKQRPKSFALVILSVAMLSAVGVRLILFGVIATTQYFSNMRYELVARTFLLAATVLLVQMAFDQPWARRLLRRPTPPAE